MDILLKGFIEEMPKTCYDCPFAMQFFKTIYRAGKQFSTGYGCVITHRIIAQTKRSKFCPLVEVNGERKDDE